MQGQPVILEKIDNTQIRRHKANPFETRIHEIDFLRGILILLVLMDHIFWNLKNYNGIWDAYFGQTNEMVHQCYLFFRWYWSSAVREIVRQFVLFLFCFVSGISCAFSKNNWVRAALMIVVAFAVSTATNLLEAWKILGQGVRIDFNIIHILGLSTLIYCFYQKKSWKSLLAMCLIFLIFSQYSIDALRAIPGSENAYVPLLWYPNNVHLADWLPLFPFIGFFFAGAVTSCFIYKNKKSIFKHRFNFERPICFIGRHTLVIYLCHQIVIIPIFMIINAIVTGSFI